MLPDSDRLAAGDLFLATLNGVMPVLLLLATGVSIGFLKLYPPQDYPKLSSLIFRFTFPAAMVYTIGKMNIGRDELLVIAAHFASIFLAFPVCYLIGYKMDRPARSIASAVHTWSGSTFSNCVVIGVPIINSMFGEEAIYFCSIQIIATGTSLAFFYFFYELDKEKNAQLEALRPVQDARAARLARADSIAVARGSTSAGSARLSQDCFVGPEPDKPGYRFSCTADLTVVPEPPEPGQEAGGPRARRGTITGTGRRPTRFSLDLPAGRGRAHSLPPRRGAAPHESAESLLATEGSDGAAHASDQRSPRRLPSFSPESDDSTDQSDAADTLEQGVSGLPQGAAATPPPPRRMSVCRLIGKALLNTIKVPVVISIFLGVLYNVIATFAYPPMKVFPPMLNSFLIMLSNTTGPIGTIMLGLFLVFLIQTQVQMKRDGAPMPWREWRHELLRFSIVTLMRQLATPLLMLGLLYAFKVDPHKVLINTIIDCMPTGTLAMTLSDTYKYHNISMGLACIVQAAFLIVMIPVVYYICLAILG